jgi:ATP-dependent Lon protease
MSNLKNKIDKGITEFYLNSDIELIKKSLEEECVDVAKESTEISNFLKRLKFTQTAMVTQENNQALLDRIVGKFQDAINKNIEKPIATLINLVGTKQMSVQFRNLDKLTPDEIKEIIKGKNLVDLMDELDNE